MKKFYKNIFYNLRKMFKRYPCVKQHDLTDCGAACIATIAKYYNLKFPVTKLRKTAGTDKKGTNAFGVMKAAEEIGFDTKMVKGNSEDLIEETLPLPIIAHVNKNGLLHYIVVYELNNKEVIVADPGEGIVCHDFGEFCRMWTGYLIFLTPGKNFKEGDEKTGFFARFSYLLFQQKRLLINIFFASIIYTILGLGGAFYFKFLIDSILADKLKHTLHVFTVGILLLRLFIVFLGAFRRHLLLYLAQKMNISLVLSYYQHVMDLPMSFFDSRKTGEILSRLSDASKIRSAISGATLTVMIDSLMVVFGGIVLWLQNSKLFLITLAYIPFYLALAWGFSRYYRKINRKLMEQKAKLQSYLVESVSGAATIKAFNGQAESNLETEKRFIKQIKNVFEARIVVNLQSVLKGILGVTSSLLILWVASMEVIDGRLSIGQLLVFNSLLGYFLGPIKRLINLQPMMQKAFVAGDRLGEILDLEKENENENQKIQVSCLEGKIEFQDIEFAYGTRKAVLKNINLKINPGEKIALVGESGSGKTTMAKLILKYYTPDKGNILIDDYSIKDINLKSLRDRIGYVPQDVFLFSGTVYNNIVFGQNGVSREEVINAAKKARIHDYINSLPLRYETMIGERGSNLSGGQKQRLAIARAILKKPDILILDEATSNLDTATEKAIHDTIKKISQGITTVTIAHRLSTIVQCDKIIVIKNGEIKEMGTHLDLIEEQGMYYELWDGQTFDKHEVKKRA